MTHGACCRSVFYQQFAIKTVEPVHNLECLEWPAWGHNSATNNSKVKRNSTSRWVTLIHGTGRDRELIAICCRRRRLVLSFFLLFSLTREQPRGISRSRIILSLALLSVDVLIDSARSLACGVTLIITWSYLIEFLCNIRAYSIRVTWFSCYDL